MKIPFSIGMKDDVHSSLPVRGMAGKIQGQTSGCGPARSSQEIQMSLSYDPHAMAGNHPGRASREVAGRG
jgi:hypothetical protein